MLSKCPKSKMTKWAMGLTLSYISVNSVFMMFMAFGFVHFNSGHWWDITVGATVVFVLGAFMCSLIALRYDRSLFLKGVFALNLLVILFF